MDQLRQAQAAVPFMTAALNLNIRLVLLSKLADLIGQREQMTHWK